MYCKNCSFGTFLCFLVHKTSYKSCFSLKPSQFQPFYGSWWIKKCPDPKDFQSPKNLKLIYITEMSKEQNTSKKWRKMNKSKNALKQVARLTPKCPNGKLSFLWDIAPYQINWFWLKNQKLIGRKNLQANFSELSENRVFWICRIKKGPDPKSFNVKFFPYSWVQLRLKQKNFLLL